MQDAIAMMKTRRQAAILGLIDQHAITSQEDLRGRLASLGFSVTQATLSRDLRDLALVKHSADGAYHRPAAGVSTPERSAARLHRAIAEYLVAVEAALQMVVLKTGAGQAQPLAYAVDASDLPGVIGTVAGDDTILMVCRDAARAASLVREFEQVSRETSR